MIEIAPHSRDEMTYEDAILYCQFVKHNGHQDWRMPTEEEYFEDVIEFAKRKVGEGESYDWGWYVGRWATYRKNRNGNQGYFKWYAYPVRDV